MALTKAEERRLKALHSYQILDSDRESAFDDITDLATQICQVPIGLIGFLDKSREWLKSAIGISRSSVSRDETLFSEIVKSGKQLIVPDTLADSSFSSSPLLQKDPRIRFYAGFPLIVQSGECIGAFCIMDQVPRDITYTQLKSLRVFRDAIVGHLEVRRTNKLFRESTGMLHLCSWCHCVQTALEDGSTEWQTMNKFFSGHFEISHAICPGCLMEQRRKAYKRN